MVAIRDRRNLDLQLVRPIANIDEPLDLERAEFLIDRCHSTAPGGLLDYREGC